MKMRQLLLYIVLFTWIADCTVVAQGFDERIYEAYISGEMGDWHRAMGEMEQMWESTGSHELLYDLVVAQYGYIAWMISQERDKEAREYVKQAEEYLEIILARSPGNARAHALLGAIYGYKIGLNAYKAVVFGKRSFSENNLALELDPGDPQVWMEKGNIEFYKPAIFGSSSVEAARIYRKSVELFEADREGLKYNWLYLNTLRSLADAYIASEMYHEAKEVYLKMLRVEPRLKWMKEKVYPEFLKQYKGKF
jgi:tetratricopeptide (TPR) repeat protein